MTTIEQRKKIEDELRASNNKVRITRQRQKIIDLLLEQPNLTCKEIYYSVNKDDVSISYSTVYRTVRQLEKADLLVDQKIIVVE